MSKVFFRKCASLILSRSRLGICVHDRKLSSSPQTRRAASVWLATRLRVTSLCVFALANTQSPIEENRRALTMNYRKTIEFVKKARLFVMCIAVVLCTGLLLAQHDPGPRGGAPGSFQ